MWELISSPSLYVFLNLLQLKESVNEHLFSDKIILWRKMAKIWFTIWLKVKENGAKKNQIGENGGERKKNPSANPEGLSTS